MPAVVLVCVDLRFARYQMKGCELQIIDTIYLPAVSAVGVDAILDMGNTAAMHIQQRLDLGAPRLGHLP